MQFLVVIGNELISNAYKHAFNQRNTGQIDIQLKNVSNENARFQLVVEDNGGGMSQDFTRKRTVSLGLKLVKSLGSKQLKGHLDYNNTNGTSVILTFDHLKKVS